MHRNLLLCGLMGGLVGFSLMVQGTDSEPVDVDVVPSDNARIWQAYHPADRLVNWTWGSADAAVLTVSNCLDRTTSRLSLAASGTVGTWTIPASPETADAVYDLTLVLKRGETILDTKRARIAVPARKWTLLGNPSDRSWTQVKDNTKLFVYDRSWYPDAADTATAAYRLDYGRTSRAVGLPSAAGGYGVLDTTSVNEYQFSASLLFGSRLCASADLNKSLGLLIIFR